MIPKQQIAKTVAAHRSRIASVVESHRGSIFITLHSDLSAAAAMEVVVAFAALRPTKISMTGTYMFRLRWEDAE